MRASSGLTRPSSCSARRLTAAARSTASRCLRSLTGASYASQCTVVVELGCRVPALCGWDVTLLLSAGSGRLCYSKYHGCDPPCPENAERLPVRVTWSRLDASRRRPTKPVMHEHFPACMAHGRLVYLRGDRCAAAESTSDRAPPQIRTSHPTPSLLLTLLTN